MILVTGATGFVGRALLPRLAEAGLDVRCLVRASRRSPHLPRGIPVQISLASLHDERGLRSAMVGVQTVIHLAGAGWHGQSGDPLSVDAAGTRNLAQAAREAGVGRLIYISHLGADRASAYPMLKAKGIAEEFVRQSGLPYTIVRSALLYGEEDAFTNVLGLLLKFGPGVFFMPGDGQVSLQPLWVEDLVTCLEWSLGDLTSVNQTISLGGPEFITLRGVVEIVGEALGLRRAIVNVRQPYLRAGAWVLEQALARPPLSRGWLDYLAINRTCEITSVTRHFGLKPARFVRTLDHLRRKKWAAELLRWLA